MAVINRRVSVAAGATEPNLLAGNIFQQLRANSRVRAGIVKVFANTDTLTFTFTIGDGIVAQDAPIPPEAPAAGSGVNLNTQLTLMDVGMANDLLGLSVTNGGAGAVDVEYYILIG